VKVKFRDIRWFVMVAVLLVGCVGQPTEPAQDTSNGTAIPDYIDETSIAQGTSFVPLSSDVVDITDTPEITPTPAPYLKVDSQINRLPAGSYLVYYDLKTNQLEAISSQITTTTIATGNEVFTLSPNINYALVDQKLVDLITRENFLVPVLEASLDCHVTSISRHGDTILANCEYGGIQLFKSGGEWQNILPDNMNSLVRSDPVLSPDDHQAVFCMQDTLDENKIRLYRVDLDLCADDSECELVQVSSSCEDALVAWSPDAKLMAVSDPKLGIQLLEFNFGTKTELLAPEKTHEIDAMFWSPDGHWIAYAQSEGTDQKPVSSFYLINATGSEPRLFYQSDHASRLVGWLNVISEFKPNNRYEVIPSEDQFWLKDIPSEDGFNLKLFIPDEKIRVNDQSEVVNGQKWWQIRVAEFTGWVPESALHFQDDWMFGLLSPVFEPGKQLIVKQSGNDVRLREMPSLTGNIKRYLQPGMKLLIVDGPAVVNNYNWWLVEIEESKIYGWVVEEAYWYASIN